MDKQPTKQAGNFILLITRNPIDNSVRKIQKTIYQKKQKVILVLWDIHIRDMLALKAAGIEPAVVIEDIYKELIIAIGEAKK